MPRPSNEDLRRDWKVSVPATLAGTVELLLMDPVLRKPHYAARSKLINALLEKWVAEERGLPEDQIPGRPTLESVLA